MGQIPNDIRDYIVDVGGSQPELYLYVLIGATGSVTLTGIFVGANGEQVGAAVSYTVTSVTATTLTTLYNTANSLASGTALPSNLRGFLGTSSGNLYVGFGGQLNGTILGGDTPAAGYPILVQSNDLLPMGRVAFTLPGAGAGGGSAGAALNGDITVLASSAQTTTQTSASITHLDGNQVVVYLNVSVASGTGGLQLRILGIDPVSGNAFPLNAAPASVIATGQYSYVLGPGCNSAGGSIAQATATVLPRTFQVQVVSVDGTSSYTYSVGASLSE